MFWLLMLIVEITMIVLGIKTLSKGQVWFTQSLTVTGPLAKIIGAVLIIPLPVGLCIRLLLEVFFPTRGKYTYDIHDFADMLELVVGFGCGFLAVLLGLIAQEPARRKRDLSFDEDADKWFGPPARDDTGPVVPGKETGIRPGPEDQPPR
jgi:hypothetical protein